MRSRSARSRTGARDDVERQRLDLDGRHGRVSARATKNGNHRFMSTPVGLVR